MRTFWLLSGSIELLLCFFLAVLVTWVGFRAANASTPDLDEADELRKGNLAVAIVLASMLLSSGIVVREAVAPVMATLRTLVSSTSSASAWAAWAGYTTAFVVGACFLALVGLVLGVKLFGALTHDIDEPAEIARGNVAVAVVVAAVVVVVGLFLGNGVGAVLEAAMPWADVPGLSEPAP